MIRPVTRAGKRMPQTAMPTIDVVQAWLRAKTTLLMDLRLTVGAAGGPVELALLERDVVRPLGQVDPGALAEHPARLVIGQRRVAVGDDDQAAVVGVEREGDRDLRLAGE